MTVNRFTVDPNTSPAGDAGRVTMWRYLFVGLFTIGVIATLGAIFLMATGKDSAPAWILVTAIVTGTIGLFSDSPVQSKKQVEEEEEEVDPNP